jgi:exosortase C (VPDSG-CTERM-specific)
MTEPAHPPAQESAPNPERTDRRLRGLGLTAGLLLVCFGRPLFALGKFAIGSELYSYILLVPFISLYLGWIGRKTLPPASAPDGGVGAILLAAGAAALAGFWVAKVSGAALALEDSLALLALSFVLLLLGACALFLGKLTFRALAFPLGFLVFIVPMPVMLNEWIETFLQQGSAAVAYAFFKAAGTAVFYQDLVFRLPGFSMQVAPECSGIHSSLVLFITSLLAGHLFLRTAWKRTVLAVAVIPLALLRNGFRVFTIGELCVHISPDMINSYIHRRGGPVFFLLSLVPFFLLLLFLMKSDRPAAPAESPPPKA